MEGGREVGRGWSRLARVAAVATYLLIVLGGVVRITGSGMGCGDDWPLCNGEILPPLDLPTLIEYSHRLAAAGVSALVAALAGWGWASRRRPGGRWRARLGAWALALLAVQVVVGAVTVWLGLPPWSVVLHLSVAMASLAVLVVAALGPGAAPGAASDVVRVGSGRVAWGLVALAAAVVLLGALVANLGAAPACRGFPLCNDRWLPEGSWRTHLHWAHRVAAYALVAGALAWPWWSSRRGARAPGVVRVSGVVRAAWVAAGLAMVQVVVAAVMVLEGLPAPWRALHVGLGAAVFAGLVASAHLGTRRPHRRVAD